MNNFSFSEKSEQILNTVKRELNLLAHEVLAISPIDFSVVDGWRDKKTQEKLYKEHKTKTLNSKHCSGEAIDIVPFINDKPDYNVVMDCAFIVGLFYAKAHELEIKIRVGALWDGNSITYNTFLDIWHIEVI